MLARLRMPAGVLDALACPHCGGRIGAAGNALACTAGHAFDVAREGYASLLTGARPTGTADTAAMVADRAGFLAAGHFAPLTDRLAERAAALLPPGGGLVTDVGAGTGHHLAHVLDAAPAAEGLALDVSKYALRRAAKSHPRSGAAACDAWTGLPVQDGAAALLLNVFAPRDAAEFRRVLAPGGALLVVTPGEGHLRELIDAAGLVSVGERKRERLAAALAGHFTLAGTDEIAYPMRLPHRDAETAAGMGPSAHHTAPEARAAAIARLPDPVEVTASFTLSVFRPS
ncbi:methyltransferase domain-containing protein [Nocardiopsis coralliicola]